MNKKIINIIILLILVVVVGAGVYYFYPIGNNPKEFKLEDYFEFKVVNQELVDWEIAKFKKSFDDAKAQLEANPDNFAAWLTLGSAKKALGDYQGAEEAWLHVNEIRPKNSPSFIGLYDLYTNFTKEYDKALPMYQKAIENTLGEDKNVEIYRDLYYFYLYHLNDQAKAEETLKAAIVSNSTKVVPLVLLAQYYRDRAFYRNAVEYYEKALELETENKAAIQSELDAVKQLQQ